jgi:O-antigen/teichoic acid export membrane protein
MSVLKKLASETVIYGLSSILGRLIYYLLVTVHTAYFKSSELAITIDLFVWAGLLIVVYTFGMETTFFRYVNKTEDKQKVYNQTHTAVLIVTLTFTLLFILLAKPIASMLGYPVETYPNGPRYITWMALIIGIDAAVAIPFAKLRNEKKSKRFAVVKFINILINVGLNLLFVVGFKAIYDGDILTSLQPLVSTFYSPENAVGFIFLANFLANIYMLFAISDYVFRFKPTLNFEVLKEYWVYAYPILIVGLAGVGNSFLDRLVLEGFLPDGFYPGRTSKEILGIYGNCIKLAIFMNLAVQAFRYAADPFFFSKAKDKNAPEVFALVMKWFIIVCCCIWIGVSLNLNVFGQLLRGKDFREALPVVPILLLANLFLGVYYNLSFWFKIKDKTKFGTYLTIMAFTITLVANWVLIPKLGYMGCAWAFLLSTFSMVAVCYLLGEKEYPVPYDLKSAVAYIGIGIVLILVTNKIKFDSQLSSFLLKNFVFVLFLAGIYVYEVLLKSKRMAQ